MKNDNLIAISDDGTMKVLEINNKNKYQLIIIINIKSKSFLLLKK